MTAEVLRWPRHLLYRTDHPLAHGVKVTMTICRTCGAADEELATECPGHRLHPDEFAAVRNGHLDYRKGRWEALA